MTDASRDAICLRGARQNNLKNLDLDIPLNELIVVTGVRAPANPRSCSTRSTPKASAATSRPSRPSAPVPRPHGQAPGGSISGIPPAIAIDQTNPVRTSRSTVGTMTELNDHLKLLFARAAHLYCAAAATRCAGIGPRASTQTLPRAPRRPATRASSCLPGAGAAELQRGKRELARQGYALLGSGRRRRSARAQERPQGGRCARAAEVVQDRLRARQRRARPRARVARGGAAGGAGRVNLQQVDDADPPRAHSSWRYSSELHCAGLRSRTTRTPAPSASRSTRPLGACETCRGFGRTIGIDYGLVIPDERSRCARAPIKPWQTRVLRGVPGGSGEVREASAASRSIRRGASSAARRAAG